MNTANVNVAALSAACLWLAWTTACGSSSGRSQSSDPDASRGSVDSAISDVASDTTEASGNGDGSSPTDAPSSDVDGQSAPVDASTDVARDVATGPGCRDGAAETCGAPVTCGPVVAPQPVSSTPPAAQGGSIVAGLYVLTRVDVYQAEVGSSFQTLQNAIVLTASQFGESSFQGGVQQSSLGGTYTASGTTFTRNVSCPTAATLSDGYTATPSSLTLFRAQATSLYADVYTLQ